MRKLEVTVTASCQIPYDIRVSDIPQPEQRRVPSIPRLRGLV
jgi:hypothetical protein